MTQREESDIRERALELLEEIADMAPSVTPEYHKGWWYDWLRRGRELREQARREACLR